MSALEELLEVAEREHQLIGRELTRAAQSMVRRMESIVANVEKGYGVNELGEVQGSGVSLDILCGRYMTTAQEITKLKYYLKREETI